MNSKLMLLYDKEGNRFHHIMFSCCQVVGLTWYNLRIITFTGLQVQCLGQANIQFPTGRIYLDSPPTQVKVHPIILGKFILEVFINLVILENELICDCLIFILPTFQIQPLVVWFSISSLGVQASVVVVMDMIHIKMESKWKKRKINLDLSADSFSGFSLNMPLIQLFLFHMSDNVYEPRYIFLKSSLVVKLLPMFQKLFPSINQTFWYFACELCTSIFRYPTARFEPTHFQFRFQLKCTKCIHLLDFKNDPVYHMCGFVEFCF